MGAFLKLFLLALLLTTVTTTTSALFDHWKLALQWPPAVNPKAFDPPGLTFTIHGLWHDNEDGNFRMCPAPQDPFNYTLLQYHGLIKSLSHCWPDVKHGGGTRNNEVFWRNEWFKHGGCSESIYPQVKYFGLAVHLYNSYKLDTIWEVLSRASVRRRSWNSWATVNGLIFNAKPILTCFPYNRGYNYIGQALKEVHLCFEKQSLRMIKCPPPPPPNNLCSHAEIYIV